jgi:hypothetical protein
MARNYSGNQCANVMRKAEAGKEQVKTFSACLCNVATPALIEGVNQAAYADRRG